MNDKYKEFATQATEDILGVPILNQKLFAELMVKECAAIALKEDFDPSDCILKHFGVN